MALPSAATLSNWSEVLKSFYLPAIQEQLNEATPLASMIDKNEEDVSGTNATIECHYGRNIGTGARADGGSMPTAGYQKFKKAIVPTKYLYGRITFTGPTIAATRDDRGAYARVIDTEVNGIVKDLAQEVNRQLWGCGYGVISRWRTTGSGTSYTVQKKYTGNTAGGDGFGSTFGAKYLSENNSGVPVVLSGYSSGFPTTVDATNIDVSAITESTDYDTITVTDPAVTEAAGTYYIRPGNSVSLSSASAVGAGRLEMMGLRGIVTDEDLDEIALYNGTNSGAEVNDPLQGLAKATYSWWNAQVDSSSTRYGEQRQLTFEMMDKMFDKVEDVAGKDYGPDLIMTTRAIRREYTELCRGDRRFVNTMNLDGGWKAIEHNGIPLMVDSDAIDGEIYFLTLKDLAIYRMSDYNWMDKDGSVLSRISDYDAYEAILFRYAELGCKRRNSQGVIADIAYSN